MNGMTPKPFDSYITKDECKRVHEQIDEAISGRFEMVQRDIDGKYDESLRDRTAMKAMIVDIRKELKETRQWAITTFVAVILGMATFISYTISQGGFATNREVAEIRAEIRVVAEKQIEMAKMLEDVRQEQIRLMKLNGGK